MKNAPDDWVQWSQTGYEDSWMYMDEIHRVLEEAEQPLTIGRLAFAIMPDLYRTDDWEPLKDDLRMALRYMREHGEVILTSDYRKQSAYRLRGPGERDRNDLVAHVARRLEMGNIQ